MKLKTRFALRTLMPFRTANTDTCWSPWTLHLPFLLFFVSICIAFIIIIELLIQSCFPDGCPVFGEPSETSGISIATGFVYNFLPTILSVGFGLLWSVAHHDYMRMEPWFQLSKDEGAEAEESLLTQYPYLFPPLTLFQAAKRRHSAVFISTLILLFIALVLSPITAGMFDEALVLQQIPHNTTLTSFRWQNTSGTYPTYDSDSGYAPIQYSSSYLYLAYSYAWLNSTIPAFITPEFALGPWASDPDTPPSTWTGPTTLYAADLSCTEAQKTPLIADGITMGYNLTHPSKQHYYTLWDYTTFNVTDADQREYFSSIFPYFPMPGDETPFASNSTPWNILSVNPLPLSISLYPQIGLFLFGNSLDGGSIPSDITATFCKPFYTSQPATAIVNMPSGAVVSVTRDPDIPPVEISLNRTSMLFDFFREQHEGLKTVPQTIRDAEYRDSFGYLVGLGYIPQRPPNHESQLFRRFGGQLGLGKYRHLSQGSHPGQEMLAFAMHAKETEGLEGLLDVKELETMVRECFKLLFAMLCTDEWLAEVAEKDEVEVVRSLERRGYRANIGWCRAVEGGCMAVAVAVIGLWVVTGKRRSRLDGEVSSLAAAMGILGRSPEVVQQLEGAEFYPRELVKRVLVRGGRRYRVRVVQDEGPVVEVFGEGLPVRLAEGEEVYQEKIGWPVSPWSGIVFLGFFAGLLGVLASLYGYDRANDGVPIFASSTSFGYKLVFSYLPTFIGLSIEPLLVTLGSHYCMLAPYRPLLAGSSSSPKSLGFDYDKSPPHFQVLRSIRVWDFPLAGLSIAILLSNVLAVTLGGMFSPKSVHTTIEHSTKPFSEPQIVSGFPLLPGDEMHYTLYSNLSGLTTAPNWTTPEYYIQPFELLPTSAFDTFVTASMSTFGFGASLSCEIVPQDEIIIRCLTTGRCLHYDPDSGQRLWRAQISLNETCWPHSMFDNTQKLGSDYIVDNMDWVFPGGDQLGRSASCPDTFYLLWMEQEADKSGNASKPFVERYDTLMLRCHSSETVVRLTATVDAKGNVLAVDNIRALTSQERAALYEAGINETDLLSRSFLDVVGQSVALNEDLNPLSWFNYDMATLHNDFIRDVGPNITHIPNRDILPSALEDVWKRLYAIHLRLYASSVLQFPNPVPAVANVVTEAGRVTLQKTMFIIGGSILVYTILLLGVLYWGPGRVKSIVHNPTCLATMWAGLYASDAKAECAVIKGSSPKERVERLEKMGGTYQYGSFVGQDGINHVGVFKSKEQVTVLEDTSEPTRRRVTSELSQRR